MWVEWPYWTIGFVNALGVPLVHLGVSWLFARMPQRWFRRPCRSGRKALYEKVFLVRRWRDHLPDAAPWVGGEAKATLTGKKRHDLPAFAAECLRGIYAHWTQFWLLLLFMLWTPAPWAFIFLAYSLLLNLPCIINLNYTRTRLARVGC